MSRQGHAPCVYCNIQPGTTRDHVIARSFFMPPLPNMRTVRACPACNAAKATDETYFRDMVVMQAGTERHPVAEYVRENPVLRSAGYGSSRMVKDAVFKGRLQPYHTKRGVYLGHFITVPVDGGPVVRTLERIVRGFYYLWRDGARLPIELNIDVGRVEFPHIERMWNEFTEAGAGGPGGYGTVFVAKYFCWGAGNADTLWMLRFYEGAAFTVATAPRPPVDETSPEIE